MPIKSKTILLGNKLIQKQGLVYTCLKKLSIDFLFLKKVDDKQRTHKIFTVHQGSIRQSKYRNLLRKYQYQKTVITLKTMPLSLTHLAFAVNTFCSCFYFHFESSSHLGHPCWNLTYIFSPSVHDVCVQLQKVYLQDTPCSLTSFRSSDSYHILISVIFNSKFPWVGLWAI